MLHFAVLFSLGASRERKGPLKKGGNYGVSVKTTHTPRGKGVCGREAWLLFVVVIANKNMANENPTQQQVAQHKCSFHVQGRSCFVFWLAGTLRHLPVPWFLPSAGSREKKRRVFGETCNYPKGKGPVSIESERACCLHYLCFTKQHITQSLIFAFATQSPSFSLTFLSVPTEPDTRTNHTSHSILSRFDRSAFTAGGRQRPNLKPDSARARLGQVNTNPSPGKPARTVFFSQRAEERCHLR